MVADAQFFDQAQRYGKMYAESDVVAGDFKGSVANCTAAVLAAVQSGIPINHFMSKAYIVHGKLSIETTLAIAMLKSSGAIHGLPCWKFDGQGTKDLQCTCKVMDAQTGEVCEHTLTWEDVRSNDWHTKPAWKRDAKLMLRYRSFMQMARLYYPEILYGLYSKDEVDDMPAPARVETQDLTRQIREQRQQQLEPDPVTILDQTPANPAAMDEPPEREPGDDGDEF